MKTIKWLGTVAYTMGMLLTSFNIYPYNLIFGAIGGAAWCSIAMKWEEREMTIVEAISFSIYFIGIINYAIHRYTT